MPLFRRDPARKLRKSRQQKMEAAMHALRRGDVRENARLVAEADRLQAEIDAIESSSAR